MEFSRRDFMKMGAQLGVMLGLGAGATASLAASAEELARGQVPVLWLQGQACSGCSISLLNTENPSPLDLLTKQISLAFHSTISAATGEVAGDIVRKVVEEGNYLLVVEGSIPAGMPDACLFNHEQFTEVVKRAARNAMKIDGKPAVVAVGACAVSGGIPGADGNPTGAVGLETYFKNEKIDVNLINLPGCPTHPDWVVGSLVYAIRFKTYPELDKFKRPKIFYGKTVHDQCPRFADYENEIFAKNFSEPGCLFKLGCVGPITYADCTIRMWNGGMNSCINAGAPCIGCASEYFAQKRDFPFYPLNIEGKPFRAPLLDQQS